MRLNRATAVTKIALGSWSRLMMPLLLLVLAGTTGLNAQPTTYTISTPFTTGTATGVLGGTVSAAQPFDGVSQITLTLTDGIHSAAAAISPVAGSRSARWSLTVPNAAGSYTLSGSHSAGSIATDPAPQSLLVERVKALSELRDEYKLLRCGAFFSWGMATFEGIQWATADQRVDNFAPTSGLPDIDRWLDTVVAGGCKYAMLTTKHIDGFALWPTSFALAGHQPYSIAQTRWYAANGEPDVWALFTSKARARGLKPAIYFSIQDNTYEARSRTTPASDPAGYTAMVQAQLTELLTYYGNVLSVWTDSWGAFGHQAHIPLTTIQDTIKGLQPNALLAENDHQHPGSGDIDVWEVYPGMKNVPSDNTAIGELTATIRWHFWDWFFSATGWRRNGAVTRSPRHVADEMAYLNERHVNLVLNFSPDKAGRIDQAAIDAFAGWSSEAKYTTNLAAGKAVTASSVAPGSSASFLTDGILQTGCTSTSIMCGERTPPVSLFYTVSADAHPWAEVDLGAPFSIGRVELFNRTDSQPDPGWAGRFRDLTVTIYDETRTLVYTSRTLNAGNGAYGVRDYADGPGQITVDLETPVIGRRVRLARAPTGSSDDQRQLALMEIEVFAPLPAAARQ
jgi:alpha-L-fucosidase